MKDPPMSVQIPGACRGIHRWMYSFGHLVMSVCNLMDGQFDKHPQRAPGFKGLVRYSDPYK